MRGGMSLRVPYPEEHIIVSMYAGIGCSGDGRPRFDDLASAFTKWLLDSFPQILHKKRIETRKTTRGTIRARDIPPPAAGGRRARESINSATAPQAGKGEVEKCTASEKDGFVWPWPSPCWEQWSCLLVSRPSRWSPRPNSLRRGRPRPLSPREGRETLLSELAAKCICLPVKWDNQAK